MVTKSETRYYSVTETAVLIRAELKKKFPGIVFSVKSKKYAGGASIDVHWNFGPTEKEVNNILSMYSGAGFDGMTDYQYSKSHWLLPDGSIQYRYIEQTYSSTGVDTPQPPGAVPVHFGSDYVHGVREYGATWEESQEFINTLGKDLCTLQGVEWKGHETRHLLGPNDDEWVSHRVHQLLSATPFGAGQKYLGVRYQTQEERETCEDKGGIGIVIVKSSSPAPVNNNNEPAPAPGACPICEGEKDSTVKFTVSYNTEKNGIELRFPVKPSSAVLEKLKVNNFRWSRFSSCWYHHDTPDVRDFINNTDWNALNG